VKDSDTAIVDRVVFSDAVEGFTGRRGPFTAFAFVALADSPLPADAISFHFSLGDVSGLEVDEEKSACFDTNGSFYHFNVSVSPFLEPLIYIDK
jgi:hypothetical protein